MKKFFKEIFSSENLRKATIYALLSQSNITASDYIRLTNALRDMESKNITHSVNKDAKIKNVA